MKCSKLIVLGTTLAMPFFASGQNELEVGAAAPALTVTTHAGVQIDLAELYAKGPVALYFYPKSDTPGCTKQACNIRDNYSQLTKAGITVLGISSDVVDKQTAFVSKYNLPFIIVADSNLKLGKAFGVARRAGTFYARQTYLVVDGKIAWRDLNAKPTTQSENLLAALEEIRKSG